MNVLVTGGTGFIGRRLVARLRDRGDSVTVVTRRPDRRPPAGVVYVGPGEYAVDHEAVVNLAGEPLFGRRWSTRQKRVIRASRVEGTRGLTSRIKRASPRPAVLVSASAIGYYGDRGDEELTEESLPGDGFLADVVQEWERAASRAEDLGTRTVLLRIGVVLGRDGGALARMLPPFRLFLGGPVGSGRQWLSWIHQDDLTDLILFAMDSPALRGPVNATSPEPRTMGQFARSLGRALGRPSRLPVPGILLRLLLGEVATVILGSSRVLPRRAEAAGFKFASRDLDEALRRILS